MISRRGFVNAVGAGIVGTQAVAQEPAPARRKRLAVVTTEWRERSHAWHMAERFLHGYPKDGSWHRPPFDVVSAYVDQTPPNDLSRQRAHEFGFTIHRTIAETLRCCGNTLAVDAVLIIGEHGRSVARASDGILESRWLGPRVVRGLPVPESDADPTGDV